MVGCIGMANPSKNVGRRLDLTNTQAVIGLIVAFFTVLGALGAVAQGWAAYHDWACNTAASTGGASIASRMLRTSAASSGVSHRSATSSIVSISSPDECSPAARTSRDDQGCRECACGAALNSPHYMGARDSQSNARQMFDLVKQLVDALLRLQRHRLRLHGIGETAGADAYILPQFG
jgi:hypothetical protein